MNNGSKIWEVKRRVTKKNTIKNRIKDLKRKILQISEEIIEEYKKTREPSGNNCRRASEKKVRKCNETENWQ